MHRILDAVMDRVGMPESTTESYESRESKQQFATKPSVILMSLTKYFSDGNLSTEPIRKSPADSSPGQRGVLATRTMAPRSVPVAMDSFETAPSVGTYQGKPADCPARPRNRTGVEKMFGVKSKPWQKGRSRGVERWTERRAGGDGV